MARTRTPDPAHTGFGGGGTARAQRRHGQESTRRRRFPRLRPRGRVLRNQVNAFLKEEGVAVALTPGYNGDGGTIFATYGGSQDPKDPVGRPWQPLRPSSTTASAACCSTASHRS